MYVEKTFPTLISSKTTESVYIFRRGHRSLDEFGAARKLAALSGIGPVAKRQRGRYQDNPLKKLVFY